VRGELLAAGDFGKAGEDVEAAFFGKADVFIGSLGGSWKSKDGVAAGDEAIGDGVEDFIVDCVAGMPGPGYPEQRKGEPLADKRDVPRAVERECDGLEVAEVLGHECRVVIGAGAIGPGNENHQGLRHVLFSFRGGSWQ